MLRPPLVRTFVRSYQRMRPSPSVSKTPGPPRNPRNPRTTPPPPHRPAKPNIAQRLTIAFGIISFPLAFINSFPNLKVPAIPDPPSLHEYSKTPLSSLVWTHPIIAAELAIFRIRRGEHVETLRRHFSYTPLNFISADEETRWHTAVTHIFTHTDVFHWGMCMFGVSALLAVMVQRYNAATAAALFVGCGTAAVFIQNAIVKPESREARLPHVGSSGALMALLTISAIEFPKARWSILFMPFAIPGRAMLAILVAYDVAGLLGYQLFPNVSHGGHLAGDVAGFLAWFLWLRRGGMIGKRR